MIIHLFGSTTPVGKAFKKLLLDSGHKEIIEYTRKNLGKPYISFDLNRPDKFNLINTHKTSTIVSFAPIWIISRFLNEISIIKPEFFNHVQKILICSSSSVVTKRYSFNSFDQKLSKSLEESENSLIKLCESIKLDFKIVRPTLIYGSYGGFKDKNFSKIIKFMRVSPLLLLPKNSGYRQPISCYELANVFFNLFEKTNPKKKIQSKILVGGDTILTFNEMLIAIKNSTNKRDRARKCFLIFVPDKIFIFLISSIFILSRKKYEALLRVFANLSHFTQQHQLTNKKSKFFPNKDF